MCDQRCHRRRRRVRVGWRACPSELEDPGADMRPRKRSQREFRDRLRVIVRGGELRKSLQVPPYEPSQGPTRTTRLHRVTRTSRRSAIFGGLRYKRRLLGVAISVCAISLCAGC
jgi:hypothetical protein